MSKAKQIWTILFPYGFWYTYIPSGIIIAMQVWLAFFNRSVGAPDWALALNCICITFALYSIYKTYRFRAQMSAEQKFMQAVFETVRPRIEALHSKAMEEMGNVFDPAKIISVVAESAQIIDEEVERRKSLARVSKTDKP